MLSYKRINNLTGWTIFVATTIVYWLTAEPTGSFWDCGEFISCAYKLQVAHSPGAPLFILIAHLVTLLAPDPSKVAITVNYFSGVMSALTNLFLFWTITALGLKILGKKREEVAGVQLYVLMAAGAIGALANAFSDSFWFSAVEGEVYASSAFFTAIGFWAILKWDAEADEPHADRWILFIGYMIGLSVGVHLLNLLTIPSIVFVYYLRRYKVTNRGMLVAFLVGCVILGFVQYGVIQYIPTFAAKFDILFVNSFGMPFNSGETFFFLLLTAALVYGIIWSKKRNKYLLNMGLLTTVFIIVGYSTYVMVVIRANANPSINMSNPNDPIKLLGYLNREQYGDRPLAYGPTFAAQPTSIDMDNGEPHYSRDVKKKKYVILDHKPVIQYAAEDKMPFPRIWDNDDAGHIRFYQSWLNLDKNDKPTMANNMNFFFTYQVGFMYWRYFMWNFSGRQDDVQGTGDLRHGNWITGISFIDKLIIGDTSKLPAEYKDNKGTNKMYMLPFILGLIGAVFHFNRKRYDAWVVLMLFFFTGLAIVIYLNQTPLQPRERDYSYAGSTYAYAIWIGIGVLGVFDWLRRKLNPTGSAAIAIACCAVVPILMGTQEWDDHDRSHRYTARDFGRDYLESCAPNAILFTQGDNDTYPLWYAQEVEGIRPDVRILNLSLLGVDWYIDETRRKINDADAVNISLDSSAYLGSNHDYIRFYDNKNISQSQYYPLNDVMNFMFSTDRKKMVSDQSGKTQNYFPVKNLYIPVDKQEVLADHVVQPSDTSKIVDRIQFRITKNTLLKNDLMVMEILRSNLWKRPIYFAISVDPDSYIGLDDYLQQEGLAYRVVPYITKMGDALSGGVQADLMYDNVMNKFAWGGVDKYDVYLDENIMRMVSNLRSNFSRLSTALLDEGKKDSAIKVLDYCQQVLPEKNVPVSFLSLGIAENYIKAGAPDKGNALMDELMKMYEDRCIYIASLDPSKRNYWNREVSEALYTFKEIGDFAKGNHSDDLAKKSEDLLQKYYYLYVPPKGQQQQQQQ